MFVATSAYSLLATAAVVVLARLLLNSNPALDDILARLHDILRATERKKEQNHNKSETGTRGGETLDRSLARKTSVCCKIEDKGRYATTTKERKQQQILRKKKKTWSILLAFRNCGLIFLRQPRPQSFSSIVRPSDFCIRRRTRRQFISWGPPGSCLLSRISCARCTSNKVVIITLAAHFSNNAPTNLLVAAKYSRFLYCSSDPRRLMLRNNNRSLQLSEILNYKIASPGRKT
jgi:hypothetical protein